VLDTQHTFQIGDSYRLYTDSEEISTNGELGDPKWTGRLSASLLSGDWGYFWNVNFIGDADNYDGYGGDTATYRGDTVNVRLGTDTVMYHSLSASYNFQDQEAVLRIGVSNATDKKPPRLTTLNLGEVSTQGNSAFYSQYNWAGRTIFMNFSKAF
jgi:iron complex outermembrane receptor protein